MERRRCQPGLSRATSSASGRPTCSADHSKYSSGAFATTEPSAGGRGFDPARDIDAITVNRWPHGYAYEYNPLWDPAWPPGEAPNEIAPAAVRADRDRV